MTAEPGPHFDTPYNVVAAFGREGDARVALRLLPERGIPAEAVTLGGRAAGDTDDKVAALRDEMQDEVVNSWGAPAFLLTGDQARAAFWGTFVVTLAFAAVGLVAGIVWAVFFDSVLGPWARVVLVVLLAALTGGTIGFLGGGGFERRIRAAGEPSAHMDDVAALAERDVLVGVHSDDRVVAERAATVLGQLGADRVALVDASGTPLPPQKGDPRPADPPGWWWKRAGRG